MEPGANIPNAQIQIQSNNLLEGGFCIGLNYRLVQYQKLSVENSRGYPRLIFQVRGDLIRKNKEIP
jgi:hypothetical protein